jgi:hypothetical protein
MPQPTTLPLPCVCINNNNDNEHGCLIIILSDLEWSRASIYDLEWSRAKIYGIEWFRVNIYDLEWFRANIYDLEWFRSNIYDLETDCYLWMNTYFLIRSVIVPDSKATLINQESILNKWTSAVFHMKHA